MNYWELIHNFSNKFEHKQSRMNTPIMRVLLKGAFDKSISQIYI